MLIVWRMGVEYIELIKWISGDGYKKIYSVDDRSWSDQDSRKGDSSG